MKLNIEIMKNYSVLLAMCLTLLGVSCAHKDSTLPENKITSYPFQNESGGRWGMMDPQGKVLFDEEFVNEPTLALNDRFMVRNSNGLWEIYTAEKKPRQIGKAYASAALFKADVAPVSEPGGPIEFIDREGNVKFTLDRMDGITVQAVNNFREGLAVFQLSDGRRGVIDTNGKVVIPAQYALLWNCSDGKFIALKQQNAQKFAADSLNVPMEVIDKNGKTLFTFTRSQFMQTAPGFKEGYLAVGTQGQYGQMMWGVIDEKKQWVLTPTSRMREITDIKQGKVVFNDGTMYGLMTLKGEVVIRAKYARLFFVGDNLLWASNDGSSFFLIDSEDNRLGNEECQLPGLFTGNPVCPVEMSENNWLLMRQDGTLFDKKSYANFGLDTGDDQVVNNDLHLQDIINGLHPTATGVSGCSYTSTAEQVVHKLAPDDNAELFQGSRLFIFETKIDGITLAGNVLFDNDIATYQGDAVAFNPEAHPIGFKIFFYTDHGDRLQGKSETIYKALCQLLAKLGKTKTWDQDECQLYLASDDSYVAASILEDEQCCCLFIAKQGVIMQGNDWNLDAIDVPSADSTSGDTSQSDSDDW